MGPKVDYKSDREALSEMRLASAVVVVELLLTGRKPAVDSGDFATGTGSVEGLCTTILAVTKAEQRAETKSELGMWAGLIVTPE